MAKDKYVIKGGRVIDPTNGVDCVTEIYIDGDTIERVGGRKNFKDRLLIDATGMLVVPGLVDIHVHLREPGNEESETVKSGSEAAVRGGITSVCCMGNTKPPIDNADGVRFIYDRARDASCWVYPIAAITKGLRGEELSEMANLSLAGAVGFSDDGYHVKNARLLRYALEYSSMLDIPIIMHCEDENLVSEGHMHEGIYSGILGMPAMPDISESTAVARDIAIAEFVDAHIHICHVSTRKSVEIIREAKERGVKVTAETTPHYLTLTDKDVYDSDLDSDFKMNPPLRSAEDRESLIEAINDGTIDAIVTDHAPHSPEKKDCDFASAAFGIVGLETSVALVLSELVLKGVIDYTRMVELMSSNPSRILNLPAGTLTQGGFADITIIDPNRKWTVDPKSFASLSRNTPFKGRELTGKPVWTMVGGEIMFDELS